MKSLTETQAATLRALGADGNCWKSARDLDRIMGTRTGIANGRVWYLKLKWGFVENTWEHSKPGSHWRLGPEGQKALDLYNSDDK